ncbi:MAG TPA: pyruvate dehydrogenase (acetyl-transferring), homodimeric type [candidate division Zixibacteria bacterium]|nr:pyruvate dehydrogenase (acetyl-transferring), homodimeric type [candidate division Zixibacteria bacterium]MDD4916480.1 pyruvate dehydrogenase (acetyl-transferring), homodimeric type [candidate division Zixibacteria bacterium]MDM7973024.1 pyruvate dehydrogenase (acetyl-transferring), homodimeric type [candidate division Zixibacteria bacterium]HOZ06888.1 pyruvate dehydrogenase (acetyl-transferring), homodimeric type [candidate division Zixibacteria bacterium]HPM38728.1 pyruvate dehydrogenase (
MTGRDDQTRAPEIEYENREWLESLDYVHRSQGPGRVRQLLRRLQMRAQENGVHLPYTANTPYVNTIPVERQPVFPGSREIERRIKSIIRWNAMAMVVRANRDHSGIGGHISTYASTATLYEVGFNHFFRARTENHPGDLVYFQGHAAPGVYARAFLEGRLSEAQLANFRQELAPGGGLSSYPHPYLMPEFWQFPTVSMGLSPLSAIYQARFIRYLEDRGLKRRDDQKVWAFLGDGELDEPESLGALTLPPRERLDNLIFVINCNLQRLDGPVRGNGKIIQELEAAFRGAGWNVIKVIWGDDWDPLLAQDDKGLLVQRMEEVPDGQYQMYSVASGDYIRRDFFGKYPELERMVRHYTDEQLQKLRRGGHDPHKVYAAYKQAVEHEGSPTVILAKTIKGYGLGEAGEGRNVTHQQKKLNEQELRHFRSRFGIPLPDSSLAEAPFYRPAPDSEEMRYLKERREALGGYLPKRLITVPPMPAPADDLYAEFLKGSGDREVATTMVAVHLLSKLLADPDLGKYIVPIVPDEARTFGMESLFRKVGIYSHQGQNYDPVDKETLLYYREATDGQILEEGITEAGAMSSFTAAASAYANFGLNTVPFFFFYSMFGFQRIGDLIWAAGDIQARGFLLGGTAGRTTLAGEGLQHQDGHSHVLALAYPTVLAYDPAYAYELAVIVRDGLRRMLEKGERRMYYLTIMNEFYKMPDMPRGVEEGILKGIYKFRASGNRRAKHKVHLFGSGTVLNEAVKAQERLADAYGVAADVWSITSYKNLYWDAIDAQRWNMLNPEREPRLPYLARALEGEQGVFVAASDYLKALPAMLASWIPGPLTLLGTDGFGRSDTRPALRGFFEVDDRHIAFAALSALAREKKLSLTEVKKARKDLDIDPRRANPLFS